MDEEERRSKLLAGKEALLAFQQKKKKKGKHKKKAVSSSVDVSLSGDVEHGPVTAPASLSASLGVIDLHSDSTGLAGDVPPVPRQGRVNGPGESDVVQPSTSLPPVPFTEADGVPDKQFPDDPHHPSPLTTNSHYHNDQLDGHSTGFEMKQPLEVEQIDFPGGPSFRHSSPIPQETTSIPSAVSNQELEHQLKLAEESKQQLQNELKDAQSREIKLQNELNILHENQLNALEHAKREEANRHERQIATLQSSLLQTESSLQDLERQFSDARVTHREEVERLLQTQEGIRETLLKERDQKHAEHIARLTQEMSNQQDIAGGSDDRDEDEREAERLRMIKQKMKEIHEEEKCQLIEKHSLEIQSARDECQKQLESYRVEMEKLANSKIQEMHGQFMAAHQAITEQKNASDVALQEITIELNKIRGQYDSLVLQKNEVEEQYQSMVASHSAELERARGDSLSLEQKLNDWKEKASSLEARLQNTHSRSNLELDELRHHNEEELASTKSQYENKIQSLQSLVDRYQSELQLAEEKHKVELQEAGERQQSELQLAEAKYEAALQEVRERHQSELQLAEEQHRATLEEVEERYQSEMDDLKGSHASEVSLLEESMAESTSNKASLEIAEEHMKELQKQLEGYRRKESDFQSRMSELQLQHSEEVERMKQELDTQRRAEVERMSTEHLSEIRRLEAQLGSISAQLEAKQLEENDKEEDAIELLKSQHQKEILELQTNLLSSKELTLEDLRKELKTAHSKEVAKLQAQHTSELDALKKSLIKEWSSRLDREKSQLVAELDEVRRSEMTRLDKEHRQAMQKMRETLSQSGKSATARAEHRAAELESELEALQEEQTNWETIQQDLLSQLELARRQLKESNLQVELKTSEVQQLSQDVQQYQNQVKSLEVEISISKSEHDRDKQTLTQQVDEWRGKVNELQVEVEELQASEAAESQQSQEMLQLMDQIAAKNVTIADLTAQNDMLNTEVFSLTQKCQTHIATAESLQKQLESSWGANEEIESLKQQLAEMKGVEEQCSTLRVKVGSLESSLADKTTELEEMVNQVERANEQSHLHQERAEKIGQELELLNRENTASTAKIVELHQQVSGLQAQVGELTAQNATGGETVASLQNTIQELESQIQTLSAAQEEEGELASQNKELAKNYKQLQQDFGTLSAERDQLLTDLDQLRDEHAQALQERREEWEEKMSRQEGLVQSLEAKLNARESELNTKLSKLQQDFDTLSAERDQLLTDLDQLRDEHAQALKEQRGEWEEKMSEQEGLVQSLEAKLNTKESELSAKLSELAEMQESVASQSQLGTVIGEKSELEEGLSQARHALTDKLHEKSLLEKELSYHRVELERRLKEKQRLEELLFEKSRFEQELQSQRKQLQEELEEIESRLKVKDIEFQQREDDLKQQHSGELNHLRHDLRQKHRHELDGMVLRHNKELEELKTEIIKEQQNNINLKRELEEKRTNEISALKESHRGEMAELENRLTGNHEGGIVLLEQQYQEKLEQELNAERERLESTHQLQLQALKSVSSENTQRQLQEMTALYEEQITTLKFDTNAKSISHADSQRALHDAHTKQLEAMKEGYENELQRLTEQAAHFEEERAESVSELQRLQREIESLKAQVEAGEQYNTIIQQMNEDKLARLNELEKQHSVMMNEREGQLKGEFEARIASLQKECQGLQERLSQSATSIEQFDSQRQMEKQLLANEAAFNEEIGKMRQEYEQKIHELELAHLQHMNQLSDEYGQKEHELIALHEDKYQELLSTHEEEKQVLIQKYECEISEVELTHSRRLLELRDEVKEASERASKSFTEELEMELDAQRDKLEQQHRLDLSLLETKLRNEFSLERAKMRSDFEDTQCDVIARTQSESALRHAVKLEDITRQLQEEKANALKEQKKAMEAKFRDDLERLKDQDKTGMVQELHSMSVEHQNALAAQEAELTTNFEAKMAELELKMAGERKTQLTLLKEHYEQEWVKYKGQIQEQVESEQMKHTEELLAECKREREIELQALQDELCEVKSQSHDVESLKAHYEAELAAIKAQHDTELEAVKAHCDAELEAVKAQSEAEFDAKMEDARKKLVKEHMSKFKEVTDKLQQVHQSELESLRQEKHDLESQHLHELELLREELDARHQDDLSELVSTQKRELEGLQAACDERVSQMEREHAQQVMEQQLSQQEERESTEQILRQELSQMNLDLEARLQSDNLQSSEQVALLTQQLSTAQQEAEVAKRLLEETRAQLQDMQKQCQENVSRESVQLHGRVAELEEELREVRREMEKEQLRLAEKDVAISDMQRQFSSTTTERDVLRSTVATLRGALSNSLQLSAVVSSVLGSQGQQQHPTVGTLPEGIEHHQPGSGSDSHSHSHSESGDSPPSGLCPPRHHTLSTLTASDSRCSSSSAAESALLPTGEKATQAGAELKMTPSVDSGVASHLTSMLPSESEGALMETPIGSSASRVIGATPPRRMPSMPSMPSTDHDLTIQPLDSTTALAGTMQIEDTTSSPAVALGYSPSQPVASVLSVSFMSAESHHSEGHSPSEGQSSHDGELDETLQSEVPPELSIVPLDSTLSHFEPLPLDLPLSSSSAALTDLASLQAGLSNFHDSVCAMVQQHVANNTQLSEYQQKLSEAESEVCQLRSQLASLEESREKLQQVIDECSSQERQSQNQIKLLQAQLDNKSEQLSTAEDKIQSLVEQVEDGGSNLENELVKETEVLLQEFKVHESVENQLRAELAESHAHLTGTKEQVAALTEENQALTKQVDELTGVLETQKIALDQAQSEYQQARQDCEAMKEVNKELHSQREHQELKLSRQLEESNQLRTDYEQQLLAKQCEIHELEDMKNQLAAKEEIEERLVAEKEEVVLRLNAVQHQLATLQSRADGRGSVGVVTLEGVDGGGSDGETREELLLRELKEWTNQCQELKTRLEEAELNLHQTGQECAQVKELRCQLQADVISLQDELQRKEASLQTALSEKAVIERNLGVARSELERAKQQVNEMSAQLDENAEQLQIIQKQVDGKDQEIESLTQEVSLSKSQQQLVEEKTREVDELGVVKTHLEHQLADLTETMKEKEEDYKMQRDTLENELHRLREQLTHSAKEIELLKNEGQRKEREQLVAKQKLQDRLQQLQRDCNELGQRASMETQLKNSHADEVVTLQTALEREKTCRKKEIHNLCAQHSAEIQQLMSEHTQKLKGMQLSHLEDVRQREEEVEAQYAGQMAYLKLHHKELIEDMQAKHNSEVERIVSEHHQLMSSMSYPTQPSVVGEDLASSDLLMKIAELAPVLAREANEVNALCKITGQVSTSPQSEIEQLQAQLAAEQKRVSELNHEIAGYENRLANSEEERNVLQRELDRLRQNSEELQTELSEAQEQLAKMETSMRKATNIVTALKKELEKSRSRESGLQQRLSEGGASAAQLSDQLSRETLKNQQLSSELGGVRRQLASVESRLSASEKAKNSLQQKTQQIQSELSKAQEVAKQSRAALREKSVELERMSTTKQQEGGSLRTTLQAKELELTKTMDKLLQEKVAVAKANSELTSVTAELTRALAEAENLRRQLDSSRASEEREVEGARDELDRMMKHCQQLEAELKQAEFVQSQSSKERDSLQHRYDELNDGIRHQLNRSILVGKALKKEVLDRMGVKEIMEQLLKQEELQSFTQDSLKADKDRLRGELSRLQLDIERLKNARQDQTLKPADGISSHPEHGMQEEIMRLFALYRHAEMHRKALIVQKRYLQCQVDAFFQTQQSALLMMADMGAPIHFDSHPTQSKYPRAYARFKAVGCAVIATFRFRYVLKRKMHHLRSQINKLQRHSQKSMSLYGRPVTSTLTTTVPTSEENLPHRASSKDATAARQPSPIDLSTGIQPVLSGYPASVSQPLTSRVPPQVGSVSLSSLQSYPSLLSASPQQISSRKPDTGRSELHFARHDHSSAKDFSHPPPTVKPLQQHQETHPPQVHGTKMSKPPKSLSSSKNGSGHKPKSPSSTTRFPAKAEVDSSQDPQLTAYIKGLERLKARLSKTSM